jgi:hypothetical protein
VQHDTMSKTLRRQHAAKALPSFAQLCPDRRPDAQTTDDALDADGVLGMVAAAKDA